VSAEQEIAEVIADVIQSNTERLRADLATTQAEIAALTRERGALRDALSLMREQYERANQSGWNSIVMTRAIEDADDIANEVLAALEAGELRKPAT
jgi:DNA-binding transcriptional regulator YbjK